MRPVSFGLTGLGGYAAHIGRLLMQHPEQVRLTAVCEPDLATHAARADELRAAGVYVTDRYDDLLNLPIEAVWLPLPIPLHRPYTELALAAGKAVLCEKPAAGAVQDVDRMISARDRERIPVAIGFQDIYRPSTAAIKSRLVGGAIGRIRSATLVACWPRDSAYFGRSSWAGRKMVDGVWVLDSPASNAMAHFLNLALFFLGETAGESANQTAVEAELYRANPIENYDTGAIRTTTETGARLLTLYTHACRTQTDPVIVLRGDRGSLRYEAGRVALFDAAESDPEAIDLSGETHAAMIERFAAELRGAVDERFLATLEIARAHVVAVNGASQAAAIHTVPGEFIERVPVGEGATLTAIVGVEDLFARCVEEQKMPHELGGVPWSAKAGGLDLRGYREFTGCPPDATT